MADGLDQFDDAYDDGAQGQSTTTTPPTTRDDYDYDGGTDAGGDASYTYDAMATTRL